MFPLRDHEPSERTPVVTVGLILTNIIVFCLMLTTADPDGFIRRWALLGSEFGTLAPSKLITLVTSQFLHAGVAHIAFNMWYLWIFGDNVEARLGHRAYLLFYITSGILAALVQLAFLWGSDTPLVGASGAIAGVLGAYWALFPRHRIETIMPGVWMRATLPAGTVLFLWFALQLLSGTAAVASNTSASGGTAWWAHIGGFTFGWLVGRALRGRQERERLLGSVYGS